MYNIHTQVVMSDILIVSSRFQWRQVNIGWGNGLVPSGNKQLPQPTLNEFNDGIWRLQATMSEYSCQNHHKT